MFTLIKTKKIEELEQHIKKNEEELRELRSDQNETFNTLRRIHNDIFNLQTLSFLEQKKIAEKLRNSTEKVQKASEICKILLKFWEAKRKESEICRDLLWRKWKEGQEFPLNIKAKKEIKNKKALRFSTNCFKIDSLASGMGSDLKKVCDIICKEKEDQEKSK